MNALEAVAIRRGEPADEAALRHVGETAGLDFTHRLERLPLLLSSPDHFIYLAETSRPFGFVGAGPGDGELVSDRCGEVMGLFLLPDFQGHGMGKKLLVRGLSVLKRRGFTTAMAWVPEVGAPAEATFTSVGFEHDAPLGREINAGGRTTVERGFVIELDAFF